MNEIDEILKRAEENGIDEDIIDYIEHLKLDNEELKSKNNSLETKNQRLMNGTSPSILQKYRTANANLKNEKKELNAEIKKLQRKKGGNLAHLDAEQLGVQQRMLDDFNGMERYTDKTFPGENHPIFARFNELANKFPSRRMIVNGITAELKKQEELIDFEIETQKKNINIWNNCDKLVKSDPNGWEDQVSNQEAYLYKVTTPQAIEEKIERLKEDKSKINEWSRIKNNIQQKQESDVIYHENNAYHDIMNEFKRIYFFCTNVGGVTQYKANVRVDGFNQADMYSSLTRELERQIGLCEEPYTHNFFYSNGEGRLIPYELNRDLLRYVNENTTFVKYGKKNQYKSGNIINSKVLFEDIPLYCNKIQYRNPNLVGFNNCFYDVTKGKTVDLNPQAPILPLKNTKTELYLDAHIEDNPMRKIFYECFTEKDRKTLLAYIGCALYDKGYTQRQESLFIMGRGGTGKGLDINEVLPTPNGWVKMKDLKVGDELFDENGNICNITYKSPIHNIDCYKITFENGFEVIVDKDHKWFSKTEGERKHKVRNTKEMYDYMQKSNRKRNSFYYAIPISQPLQLEDKSFIIPPYTLGAWLGDGTADEGIITNKLSDNQIIEEIQKDGFKVNRTGVDNNLRVYIYDIKNKLAAIHVLSNKHIPQKYLRGSYAQRLALLQGIMDTDGSIDKNGSCEITWKDKKMIEQLRELLFSLGIKSNIKEKQVQLKKWQKPRTYYRLWFKTNLPVFRLKRKLERIPTYQLINTQYTRYIKKIEPAESIPTQCIQVDSPNHLFLATKEFIPTHNTTLTKAICSIFYSVGHQLVTKLNDSNQFGFSMFADSDVVIVDEIQSAPKEFAEKIKNISSADALPVEKKHHDTISVPAENVPRVFFIGNNFSKKLYEASDSAGVNRRILIIIPTQPIQDLGYQWQDLISDSCKQWLVQQATKEYINQNLHKKAIPISSISENEKLQRVELCTFTERFFINKHFEVLYVEGTSRIDDTYYLEYEAFHSFIMKQINDAMVESTTKIGVAQTFISHVKKVFSLNENYNTRQKEGILYFKGIIPTSDEAIDFFKTTKDEKHIYYTKK